MKMKSVKKGPLDYRVEAENERINIYHAICREALAEYAEKHPAIMGDYLSKALTFLEWATNSEWHDLTQDSEKYFAERYV